MTELRLTHHLRPGASARSGPGWEYYLDMLVAAREGSAQPDFYEYYPGMKSYFEDLR